MKVQITEAINSLLLPFFMGNFTSKLIFFQLTIKKNRNIMLYVKQSDVVHLHFEMEVFMCRRFIGLELRSLNNIIMRFMENNTHKKYIDSITGTNGWIIGYIAHHADKDVFQKDLEQKFSITRSTASKVINLMVQKGLIERHPVSHDARLKKLVLTPKALEFSKFMETDGKIMEQALIKGFSEQEIENLSGYIKRMKQNLMECDGRI